MKSWSIEKYSIIYLAVLLVLGAVALGQPLRLVVGALMVIVAAAGEIAVTYRRQGKCCVSYSSIMMALVLALVFDTIIHPYLALLASISVFFLKDAWRLGKEKSVVNPVAAILVVISLFVPVVSWWALIWGTTPFALITLFGLFILYRLKAFPVALSFLAAYTIITLIAASGGIMSSLGMILFDGALFFFATMMLVRPAPIKSDEVRASCVFGILVGILAALFSWLPRFWPLRDMSDLVLALVLGDLIMGWRLIPRIVVWADKKN